MNLIIILKSANEFSQTCSSQGHLKIDAEEIQGFTIACFRY